MNSEIIDISGCKKNLVIEIPAEQIDEEIGRAAQSLAAKARVPGFRPGKVPLEVIKRRYAAALREEAKQGLIQRVGNEALSQHRVDPVADPRVEEVRDEPGKPLRVTLSFEVMPALEITGYKGLDVRIEPGQVEDHEIDRALQALREENAQYIPVEDAPVGQGHLVTVDLDGEFEGGGAKLHEEDVNLIVGDPRTKHEFSENLLGARIGEVRGFWVSFPPTHPNKRFAGRRVHYRLQVKDIKEKRLPDLNDEFARDMGSEDLADLRERVRQDLVRNAERLAEEKAKEELLDRLVRSHSFDVPEALVMGELEEQAQRLAAKLVRQGIDVNRTSINWNKVFEEERPNAERTVRATLVLDAIARQEGLEVTDAELDQEFASMAQATGKPAAALRAEFEKNQRIQSLRRHLLRNKALDFVFRNANISRG